MKIGDVRVIEGFDGGKDETGSYKDIFNLDLSDEGALVVHRVEVRKLAQRALRGIHHAGHSRVLSCVVGRVFAVVVDLRPESPTFREWDGVWISADNCDQDNNSVSSDSLFVPPHCGLATLSPEGGHLLLHHCAPLISHEPLPPAPVASPPGIIWSDPDINISWPLSERSPVVSSADAALPLFHSIQASLPSLRPPCDVLLYGSTGYFGSTLLRLLREDGVDVCCSPTRLEDRPGLLKDAAFYRPKRVMNCAGVTGTPNIMWCETHKPETARANLMGLMNLLDVFAPLDVHVTTIGTGIIHCYDSSHRVDNDLGYKEADAPTYSGNVYTRLRVAQESLVEEVFADKCLTLRVQYPLSADMHRGSCLSKLLKYSKIFGLPTSMSVLDDLFPHINQLSLDRVTGPLNFTNPGRMDNAALLCQYREVVDSSLHFDIGSPEEMAEYLTIPRPFSQLDCSRLLELCPTVLPLQEAVQDMLRRIAATKGGEVNVTCQS